MGGLCLVKIVILILIAENEINGYGYILLKYFVTSQKSDPSIMTIQFTEKLFDLPISNFHNKIEPMTVGLCGKLGALQGKKKTKYSLLQLGIVRVYLMNKYVFFFI